MQKTNLKIFLVFSYMGMGFSLLLFLLGALVICLNSALVPQAPFEAVLIIPYLIKESSILSYGESQIIGLLLMIFGWMLFKDCANMNFAVKDELYNKIDSNGKESP